MEKSGKPHFIVAGATNPVFTRVAQACEYISRLKSGTEISEKFLEILSLFSRTKIFSLADSERQVTENFIAILFKFFTDPQFIIPAGHRKTFIRLNPVITSLAELSSFKNTEEQIRALKENFASGEDYLTRVLSLYSPLNESGPEYEQWFAVSASLASCWYWTFFEQRNFITEQKYLAMNLHISNLPRISDRLSLPDNLHPSYFFSTYAGTGQDREVRKKINSLIREKYRNTEIINRPEKFKVAVISGLMYPGHSVYRGTSGFLRALEDKYELTLVHLGKPEKVDRRLFKNIIYLEARDNEINLGPLQNNNFQMAIFPDIGITNESILLSNLRIAPLQITCHGHPVSTRGSEIDFFITGSEVEYPEKIYANYAEKAAVIHGTGLTASYPGYSLQHPEKEKDTFIIMCAWCSQKINFPFLSRLKEIIRRAEKRVIFRFFPGSITVPYFLTIAEDIRSVLGAENTEIVPPLEYKDYMKLIEAGDLLIDSFPFGGFNTITDALYLRKPVIALRGSQAYNNFAASLLKKTGIEELIAYNENEYLEKMIEMINNSDYFSSVLQKLNKINLDKIFKSGEEKYFRKAIDFLADNKFGTVNRSVKGDE